MARYTSNAFASCGVLELRAGCPCQTRALARRRVKTFGKRRSVLYVDIALPVLKSLTGALGLSVLSICHKNEGCMWRWFTTHQGRSVQFDDYMGSLPSSLIASCFSLPEAMYGVRRYVTRRFICIIPWTVSVLSDSVTDVRSVFCMS